MHTVHVFNTLTRTKEAFKPLHPKKMGFYSCGPTVYHFAHIGNLRSYVFADVLKRSFRYAGYDVLHVMNITDVGHLTSDSDTGEDKMEKGAAREKKTVWEVAQFYTDAFLRDMRSLNIEEPSVWCKATDHIAEQIAQIQQIEAAGCAYTIEDGVYFDTTQLPDYGKLAGLNIEGLKAGARVEMAEGKKNPTDFALWKFSRGEKRQMEWDSPWGKGFPGWHIECSAMAVKYLGPQFDIHTGGIDHIPVHHTNEIAQAEAAGLPFARYWMHGEFLVLKEGEKMAKSGDNFLTLDTLKHHGFDALDYRYFCLTAHYRKQLAFSYDALTTAKQAHASLKNKILAAKEADGPDNEALQAEYKQQFLSAITDDINMPQALAVLWEVLGDTRLGGAARTALALDFDAVLGLQLDAIGTEDIPENVMQLVREREEKRKSKQWHESDRIRDTIAALGYEVRDTPEGSVVRPK
jgi:cysteinyl-tRNA synthetase